MRPLPERLYAGYAALDYPIRSALFPVSRGAGYGGRWIVGLPIHESGNAALVGLVVFGAAVVAWSLAAARWRFRQQ